MALVHLPACKRTAPETASVPSSGQATLHLPALADDDSLAPTLALTREVLEARRKEGLKTLDKAINADRDNAELYLRRGVLRIDYRLLLGLGERRTSDYEALYDLEAAHGLSGGDPLIHPDSQKVLTRHEADQLAEDEEGYLVQFDSVRRDENGDLLRTREDGEVERVGGPGSAPALVASATLLLQVGETAWAKSFLDRAAVIDPDNVALRVEQAMLEGVRTGYWEKAASDLQTLIKEGDEAVRSRAQVCLAYCYQNLGRFRYAEKALRDALKLRHDNLEAIQLLGKLLDRRDRREEASRLRSILFQVDPYNPKAANDLGAKLVDEGQPAEAVEILRKLIDKAPTFPAAWMNLGNAYFRLGQYEDAVFAYKGGIALLPGWPDGLYSLAKTYFAWGKWEEGIRALELARQGAPDSVDLLYELGHAYAAVSRTEEAEAAFRRAIALAPEDPDGWSFLCRFYASLRRPDEARPACEKALALESQNDIALWGLYGVLMYEEDLPKAFATVDRMAAEAPAWALPHVIRGIYLVEQGRYEDAIRSFDAALSRDDQLAEAYTQRGLARWRSGDQAGAITDMKRGAELDPLNPYATIHLCTLLLSEGRVEEAMSMLAEMKAKFDPKLWEARVSAFLQGDLEPQELLGHASHIAQRCEANFYIAERVRRESGPAAAAPWYEKCVETDVRHFTEYLLARWRLAQGEALAGP